ncbi:MAG: asparagine synthase (glutamine-hydrolyzing) [Sphingobacteriales bacterium 17-39-43]|uniref:asparagine synthase (glutamine-hydrolyzing) n=1 Tax=Daejeonella sp. TaxID=2805397 RepID=UPI000BD556F2|nr:asparagine synthase (glutamine-hydrolyzing) [Daejeonella sp.]OYZ30105.1 MAG: asparagine synthase (glutamine-hydrolyzing) [Sphingobacteriales bacterium 16-39-50]OZA22823.1 MAG: asparagine synthase (glutamine-hydrolyzing) [Sphingobacteriales bacterium 17-39-43]HQT24027.1 asparagine synthase (glutamine-hydrolyzing) [Daejeonella sp.]HQT58691.1 asparagine synthase (glutamine-hydrolyzing) [Daejeonella sp.]
MCGIIGVISKKELKNFRTDYFDPLSHALDQMEYRGPDNKGIWMEDGICLGHRRLSIIDLSADGNQPFQSSCQRYVIVFNGEIYNYQELRSDLKKLGHTFRTESDTEVIIAAYIQYGKDFCRFLRGMFALVIYDREEKQVVFARDRLGKKPLFIYENEGLIIFSSEIKFFHAFKNIALEINEESLLNFLSLQYIPGPATIYKKIKQISPAKVYAHDLSKNKGETITYWNMFDHVGERKEIPEIEEIDSLLEESIKYRLVANVDIGLLLSGGIDSSLLACYMHKLAGKKVKAFNVGFADKSIDESVFAQKVAASLDLDLISLRLEDITAENFSNSIYHADQPLGDSAIIPTYLISKSIAQHVKVVLSGEGADELFHGYDHYRYEKYFYQLGKFPFDGASALMEIISGLGIHKFDKVRNKLRSIGSFKKDTGVSRWTSILSPELSQSYLKNAKQNTGNYEIQFNSFLQDFGKKSGKLESSLMLDLLTWLPDDLLVKTDRMMMACSVEARTPFLDHHLVEEVLRSSSHFNQPLFQSKNYLRQLLKKKLSPSVSELISNRPKQGFETPKLQWLNSSLSQLSSYLFSEENLKNNPYLNAGMVRTLWQDAKKQKHGTNNRLVWNIFCFLEWHRQHESKFGFTK